MTERRKIARNFLISALILLVFSSVIFILVVNSIDRSSIIVASTLSGLTNFIFATIYFFFIAWSFNKSNKAFFVTLFGGMLIKMIGLAVILIVLVLSFRTGYVWIVASFMVYYFAFQILEIIFVARYLRRTKEPG